METTRNEKFRVHIWVKGRVQGVGFRSHVEYNALQIGVLGWVRNMGYDTVEAVAEGTKFQIDEFIKMVTRPARFACGRIKDGIRKAGWYA
jgi:acylphosphatase